MPAILPKSSIFTAAISRPRALTATSASRKDSIPAATAAPYSPRLWPATTSGFTPKAARRRRIATSTVSVAGCEISVARSASNCSSSGNAGSRRMSEVSVRPRSGPITSSASRKVSATTGYTSARSSPMPMYWLPCPVKRKAS